MSTIHIHQTMSLSPEQYITGLTDSNVWGGSSGYTYVFKPLPNDRTDVDVTIIREGKNTKGRFLGLVLGTVGRSVLVKAFESSITAIAARENVATAR